MKKSLALGMASLALAVAPVFNVFAEEPQEGNLGESHDVTVGEVDETVYSVDIDWGDLSFDWKFDWASNSFNFKAHPRCLGWGVDYGTYATGWNEEWLQSMQRAGRLYSDEGCSVKYEGELQQDAPAYTTSETPGNYIMVEDTSINGRLFAMAEFVPSDGYDWVTGKFDPYALIRTSGSVDYFDNFDAFAGAAREDYGSEFGMGDSDSIIFNSYLNLSKKSDTTAEQEATITSGKKIGTVEITINSVGFGDTADE